MRVLAFAALACLAIPAIAQTFPITFVGQHSTHFKGKKRIGIASYGINYIVAQKGTAVAATGLDARAVTGLTGVDEATMRLLADEAYADLRVKLTAAGIDMTPEEEVRGALQQAGTALRPGNTESNRDGGISIGTGVKKASVAYGASAAPLTDIYSAGGGGFGAFAAMDKIQKLNGPGKAIDSVLLFPMLTLDYADTQARRTPTLAGARRGLVSTNVGFGVRMIQSTVNVVNPAYNAGSFYVAKDVFVDDDFTAGPQTVTATSNDSGHALNRIEEQKKGNVVVDPPSWIALVRAAYRDYNAAIVAVVLEEYRP